MVRLYFERPVEEVFDDSRAGRGSAVGSGFARIFPLAPAPLIFAGVGVALRDGGLLPAPFATAALLIAGLFVMAGILAVFGTVGLILAIVMSVVEAMWILAAGITFAIRTSRRLS